jgi:NAD(P)-dependent dehydrogenase (short-subunit alcohol dehydrogenase family)
MRASRELIESCGTEAEAEYDRFVKTADRGLQLSERALRQKLSDKSILVTGGTGCIGTTLLGELARYRPSRLTSISRGITKPRTTIDGVEYFSADIRSLKATYGTVGAVKPDLIFHLAAQHDPSLAELEVKRTLETNIYGTRHVIEAANHAGVPQIVYASTGKAMRHFSPEVYAASKKASEFVLAQAAQSTEMVVSGARFTHVVDNSIIHDRLMNWVETEKPIRLHSTDILFYVQSALESAGVLMDSCLNADPNFLVMEAIRDLDWPVSLIDMAVGAMMKRQSCGSIYICGYEAGYEEKPYPALFDPFTSGDAGPLVNAFEGAQAEESPTCHQVDLFPFVVDMAPEAETAINSLEALCANSHDNDDVRQGLDTLSWAILDSRLACVDLQLLKRSVKLMEQNPDYCRLPIIHRRTNEAVKAAIERRMSKEAAAARYCANRPPREFEGE